MQTIREEMEEREKARKTRQRPTHCPVQSLFSHKVGYRPPMPWCNANHRRTHRYAT